MGLFFFVCSYHTNQNTVHLQVSIIILFFNSVSEENKISPSSCNNSNKFTCYTGVLYRMCSRVKVDYFSQS